MAAFATGVLPNIYEFHLYMGIPPSSPVFKRRSIMRYSQVEPGDFTPDLQHSLRALYAQ